MVFVVVLLFLHFKVPIKNFTPCPEGQGVITVCKTGLTLHFLLRERSEPHVFGHHPWNQFDEIRGMTVFRGIRVPELDDVVRDFSPVILLGTDRQAVDDVLCVCHTAIEHRRNTVFHKDMTGVVFHHGDTIGTAIDVGAVFPQGRDCAPHEEEHTIGQGMFFDLRDNGVELAPRFHDSETCKGGKSPVTAFRGMIIQSPRSRGDRRV